MRLTVPVLALACAAAAAGCADPQVGGGDEIVLPVFASSHGSNFGTDLKGHEEVPPVSTNAVGNAIFRLSEDGSTLTYRLIVANIQNVTQSHIHIAPRGVNGPVVVFLFGAGNPPTAALPAPGLTDEGVIAKGDITQPRLIARPAIGFGATMAELVSAMRSGRAYVNVHTVAFPGGEIRGQIEERGPSN